MKEIAVVIPCIETLAIIAQYLPGIKNAVKNPEATTIILVDAVDRPDVKNFTESSGCQYLFAGKARRSIQMNFGANHSSAPILFFLHLDSIVPNGFDGIIRHALNDKTESGCFRLKFHPTNWFLSAFVWFTKLKWTLARGGDQGLFVYRSVFDEMGKFKNSWQIMEDVDMYRKLLNRKKFRVLPQTISTSSRKYREVGTLKLQVVFTIITLLYWMGVSNKTIFKIYRKLVGN